MAELRVPAAEGEKVTEREHVPLAASVVVHEFAVIANSVELPPATPMLENVTVALPVF